MNLDTRTLLQVTLEYAAAAVFGTAIGEAVGSHCQFFQQNAKDFPAQSPSAWSATA
jgi:DNA gyrase/topoisomerase IV subunit B